MIYAEDLIADVIRAAADAGVIENLTSENVFTDASYSSEWKGESKFFVIREQMRPIGDLQEFGGFSGLCDTDLSLAALGKDKATAAQIIADATHAIKRAIIGPEAEVEETGDVLTIAEGDLLTLHGDAWADTIINNGTITGDGWLLYNTLSGSGTVSPYVIYNSDLRAIKSLALRDISGTERFEEGSFRDQYFQVRKIAIIHEVDVF